MNKISSVRTHENAITNVLKTQISLDVLAAWQSCGRRCVRVCINSDGAGNIPFHGHVTVLCLLQEGHCYA
jgi:hypothetical protein